MKHALAAILALAAALLGAGAFAQVPVPPLKARVTDLTGTLSASQAQALESSLREFEQRKGSQIAVLVVPTAKPETIEQYSIRVADAWKIGRGRTDDGIIIVVAKNDREARIEVGRGLEGVIPDIIASRVIREIMVPRFQQGDFYGGLSQAAQALMKRIEGEPLPPPKRTAAPGQDYGHILVPLLIVALFASGILSRLLGTGGGAVGTGGIVGIVAWALTGTLVAAVIAGMIGFLFSVFAGAGGGVRHRGGWGGGWGGPGGGGWGGGGFGGGGGGFSGGGGGFGGGGASGRW